MSASAPFQHISRHAIVTTTSHATLCHCILCHANLSYRADFHIASRDGDRNNKVAAATTFVGSKLLVFHNVSLESNDEWRGHERKTYRIARWRRRPLCAPVHSATQRRQLIILYRMAMMTTICAPRDGSDNKTTAASTTLLPAQWLSNL